MMNEQDLREGTTRHRIAVVGGDDRVLGAKWPAHYDVRHIRCSETARLRTMVQNGSLSAIVVLTKFSDASAKTAVRGFHGSVPVRYFEGSVHSCVAQVDDLLRDILPRRPLKLPPPSERAFNPPRIVVLPPPEEEPAPAATPPTPPASAPPPPATLAAALPPIELHARYQPCGGRDTWTDDHVAKVVAIAEGNITDAVAFGREVARQTGVYRPPGGLHQRLRPLSAVCRISHELLVNLDRRARAVTKAKREFMAHEAKVMRASGVAGLGEWISIELATRLVGDVAARLEPLQMYVDVETSGHVFRKADVLKRRDELIARQDGEPLTKDRMVPTPRASADDIATNIRKIVAAEPGIAKGQLERRSGASRERFDKVFRTMVAANQLVIVPHPTRKDVVLVGPPGWTYTAPPPRAPREPKAPETPPASAPATAAPVDAGLTAEIYRAIRAKEISPEEGARMLRELRG